MRNRAKCKLCNSIIESFHSSDLVNCKCGHIFVDGGNALLCGASNWDNFLRVDDECNEIIVKVQEKENLSKYDIADREPYPTDEEYSNSNKPTKKEMLSILDDMIKSYENLPQHAMLNPITHADFCSLLLLLSSILRVEV